MYKSLSCILGLFCIFIACQSRKNNDQSSVASDTQFHVEAFREINLADHLSDCGEELSMSLFIEDVEYIKPETTDQSLIGYISKIQWNLYSFTRKVGTRAGRNKYNTWFFSYG